MDVLCLVLFQGCLHALRNLKFVLFDWFELDVELHCRLQRFQRRVGFCNNCVVTVQFVEVECVLGLGFA